MGKKTKRAGWLLLGIILLSLLLITYFLLKFLFGSDIFADIVSLFIERIIIVSGVFVIVFFLVSIIVSIKTKDTRSLIIATPLIVVFLIALQFLGPNIKGPRDGSPYWSSPCSCTEMNGVTYFRVRKVFNGLVLGKNPDTRILDNILTEHNYRNPECDREQLHKRGDCCLQYCNNCQETLLDLWKSAYSFIQDKEIETAQLYLQQADDFLISNKDCFDCNCWEYFYSH